MRFMPGILRSPLLIAGLTLLALGFPPAMLAAATPHDAATLTIDVRHIIPPFNPALDAVHAPTGFGTGKIWHVGPTREYKRPSDVARLVRDGDIVEIDAATYKCDQSVRWFASDLTLVGVGGQPVMDATGCTITGGKGIWNPQGQNLIIDNIAFIGAKVGSANGAGIRYDGTGYLYITHCYFHDNQDGILYTPDQRFRDSANVVIDHSEFDHNGMPSGQAHNMYMNMSHSFVLRFSYSHDSVVGHEVKSRSLSNYILYNRIADEATGTASYDIDLPQGGLSYIIGNVIEKGPDAQNPSNITYAVESAPPNPVQKLFIAYNTIINNSSRTPFRRVLFIRNKNLTEARLIDNLIVGVSPNALMVGDGAAKVQAEGNVITERPGFYDARNRVYYLAANSPAVNAAIPAGEGDGFSLTPKYQFVFPLGGEPRPVVGKLDVGAYEYVPGQKITPAPTVNLHAEQSPVGYNTPARLTWSATNATRCEASGGWSGVRPTSGQDSSEPLTANTAFSLSCTGPSGIARATASVTVNDSPRAAALGTYAWKRIPNSALASTCPTRGQYPSIFGTTDCVIKGAIASGVYVPATKRWYLMGGGGTYGYYGNEVYAFDVATLRPQRVTNPTRLSDTEEYVPSDVYGSKQHMRACDGILHLKSGGIAPAVRGIEGQAAYDPLIRKIVVGPWAVVRGATACGGSTLGEYATDQWSFDPFTNQWALLAPADDRFGSTLPSTWFLDPSTGIGYIGDGSRVGATRGAYLINYGATPPGAVLVNHHWPYVQSTGPVAIDDKNQYALQLTTARPNGKASVLIYDLRNLMRMYHEKSENPSYQPDASWKVTGNTDILAVAQPALTFNAKLGMFVAWAGGDTVYFMQPDYRTQTLNVISKHIDGGPKLGGNYAHAGWFTYLPDRDAYLAFLGMKQDFYLLLPPGSPMH